MNGWGYFTPKPPNYHKSCLMKNKTEFHMEQDETEFQPNNM